MKKLITFLVLMFALSTGYSQTNKKVLVADETWYQLSGTNHFKVITSNEKIGQLITNTKKFTAYSGRQKTDRNGMYWEVTYVFPLEYHNEIALLLKNLK